MVFGATYVEYSVLFTWTDRCVCNWCAFCGGVVQKEREAERLRKAEEKAEEQRENERRAKQLMQEAYDNMTRKFNEVRLGIL
jgi:hypothetical protein